MITSKLQTQNFNIDSSSTSHQSSLKDDPNVIAKKIETLFLNKFLKIMFEQTSFGQDKTVSTYLPFITSQIAESLAESGRGIGIGEFLSNPQPLQPLIPNPKNLIPDSLKFIMPVNGRITSGFGLRHDPINGELRPHGGIDIAVSEGTAIRAAASGRVVFSGFSRGYGNTVIIEHENGLSTLYAHNSANLVKVGDIVNQNSIIALSGSTGRSTGPHLHFEVRKGGTPIDPMDIIVRRDDEYVPDRG